MGRTIVKIQNGKIESSKAEEQILCSYGDLECDGDPINDVTLSDYVEDLIRMKVVDIPSRGENVLSIIRGSPPEFFPWE